MKSIALLHFAYAPAIGGVEFVIQQHAHILSEFGYKVTVLTGSGKEENEHIHLIEIPEFQSLENYNPTLQKKIDDGLFDTEFDSLVDTIYNRLKEVLEGQDIIVVHNMTTVSRNLAFVSAFHRYCENHSQKKILIYVHDHMYIGDEKIKNIDGVAKSPLEKKLLTSAFPNCEYIAISNTVRKSLLQVVSIEPERIHVVPNGINMRDFLEIDGSIWNFLNGHNLYDKFPIILSPVNILERKNLIYTVQITAELQKSFPNICHIITGSTSKHHATEDYLVKLKEEIHKLDIQETVVFMSDSGRNALKESELHDLYSLSDIVFYFSKSENFGLPIIEAGLNKNPIFTSNLEVFHEIQGEFGRYFDTAILSPIEVAAEIKKFLLADKTIQLHYKIRANYSIRKIIQTHLIPLL